jgi:hypothetical protein
VGLWRPDDKNQSPPPRLPVRLRRRASLLINMVAEVAAQATEQAGLSPAGLPIVVGSAYGELATTMDILSDIAGDGVVSPTSFQNSVHNSAAGYLSIAHENRTASTSIAAGNDTVAMVLLEAMTILATRGGEVLAIVADEALPALLGPFAQTTALAAALVLGAAPTGLPLTTARPPLAWLEDLRQDVPPVARLTEVDSPCASILPLLAAIAAGSSARVTLGPESSSWSVFVRRPEGGA